MARKKAESAAPKDPIVASAESCELCAGRGDGKCDLCGKQLDPKDQNMGPNGYQSVQPSHFHDERPVFDELCYKCHRVDRQTVYGRGYGESE